MVYRVLRSSSVCFRQTWGLMATGVLKLPSYWWHAIDGCRALAGAWTLWWGFSSFLSSVPSRVWMLERWPWTVGAMLVGGHASGLGANRRRCGGLRGARCGGSSVVV
jgi:hypothetical protein